MTEQESKLFQGMPEEDEADRNMKKALIDRRVDQYLQAALHVLRTELDLSEEVSPLTEEQIKKIQKSMSDAYSVDERFYTNAQKDFLKKLFDEDYNEFIVRTEDAEYYPNYKLEEVHEEIAKALGEKPINIFRDIEQTDQYLKELKKKDEKITEHVMDFRYNEQQRHDDACKRDDVMQDDFMFEILPQKRIDQLEKKRRQLGYVDIEYYTDTEKAYEKAMDEEVYDIDPFTATDAEKWKTDLWKIRNGVAMKQVTQLAYDVNDEGEQNLPDDKEIELLNQSKKDTKILEGIRKKFEGEEEEVSLSYKKKNLDLQALEDRTKHNALQFIYETVPNYSFGSVKSFVHDGVEHAKENDVSYLDNEIEKATKILKDIAPLEALKSELNLNGPHYLKTAWTTNHKKDVLVWNATNQDEKPIPLIDVLEGIVAESPDLSPEEIKNHINHILTENLVLFHHNERSCTQLGRTNGQTTFSPYEFPPRIVPERPPLPNFPEPLSGWEKFKDGFMKLFGSRTSVGLLMKPL